MEFLKIYTDGIFKNILECNFFKYNWIEFKKKKLKIYLDGIFRNF